MTPHLNILLKIDPFFDPICIYSNVIFT